MTDLQQKPAYVIKMRAKPGRADELFELAVSGMRKSGSTGAYIVLREDDDPDVLWNIEIFASDEAKQAYEDSPLAEELREGIMELLAEPPSRVAAHPCAAFPSN